MRCARGRSRGVVRLGRVVPFRRTAEGEGVVDAEKLVSDDTGKLGESIASRVGSRRSRSSSDQHRDEAGKLPNRFCPDQD